MFRLSLLAVKGARLVGNPPPSAKSLLSVQNVTKTDRFRYCSLLPQKTLGLSLLICFKTHTKIKIPILDILDEFWYIVYGYVNTFMTEEQKIRLLKAKVAVALQDELGRDPKQEEIEQVTMLARVLYKAVLGLHYKRKEQKRSGQLAIF